MAFPALAGTVASGNTQTANTTLTLTYPTGVTAGELLLGAICHKDTTGSRTWPAGWTEFKTVLQAAGSGGSISWAWKAAAGTETGNFTVTDTVSTRWAWFVFRLSGADTSAAPDASTGVAATNSINPNPDSLTPAGGAKDYLWIASFAISHSRIVSAYPTNYSHIQATAGSDSGTATNVGGGIAARQLNATTEDPGAFTTTGTAVEESSAVTLAVSPPAGGTNATATPSVVAAITSVLALTTLATAQTAPAVVAATSAVLAPTIIAGSPDATVVAVTVAAITSAPAPSASASAQTLTYPLNLNLTVISSSEIDLGWDAVTGAAKYDIERDGAVIVTGHVGTSYQDTGLTADTPYRYRVGARP